MYHYISGYTAKVAGTEAGVTEPKATFSPCFGGPFLPLHPMRYAALLGERLSRHGVRCWLVNTGWTGGPYGVGTRMKIEISRAVVTAILSGALEQIPTSPDPVFGLEVPASCPGVPADVLQPRSHLGRPGRLRRAGQAGGGAVPEELRSLRRGLLPRGSRCRSPRVIPLTDTDPARPIAAPVHWSRRPGGCIIGKWTGWRESST